MHATIKHLWIYPIKGCAKIALERSEALLTGLAHDRSMMVVDANTGKFLTQRSHPNMALIQPSILGEVLRLVAPGTSPIELALFSDKGNRSVTVWRDTLSAIDMGDDLAQWLSQYLAHSVRLVRFDPAQQRLTRRAAPNTAPSPYFFADGYPYLVLSQVSVDALNDRLLEAGANIMGADRFRPNIVIDSVDAHTEDYAVSLEHGSGASLQMVSPCTRCTVPNLDPKTARMDANHEPSITLGRYRYDSSEDGVVFGVNASISQTASFAVGDVLKVDLSF